MLAGYRRFCNDIFLMIGVEPSLYYKITWLIVSPVCLMVSRSGVVEIRSFVLVSQLVQKYVKGQQIKSGPIWPKSAVTCLSDSSRILP